MARTDDGSGVIAATMFLVDLPDPAIRIDRIPHTIDSLLPGGHALVTIDALRVPVANILGDPHAGINYAQVRLSHERLSPSLRGLGRALRAQEHAPHSACRRPGFGKHLVDHDGIRFMLEQIIPDLKNVALLL